MRIGYINLRDGEEMDICMRQTVALLEKAGLRVAGAIHAPYTGEDRSRCDMHLRILPDGPLIGISQDLGEHARGCRLDSAALEMAVGEAAARFTDASVLVINKFGKHEAEGRGFVSMIVDAMDRDIPVIIGVNGLNLEAFLAFSDGCAEALEAEPAIIASWAQQIPVPASTIVSENRAS